MHSTSNLFSSNSHGNNSFRGNAPGNGAKRKSNIVRSQQFRPHTPSVCNRNNDTAEMRLAEEIIRQNSEQRPTTLRAEDWNKTSPRFKPKPPTSASESFLPPSCGFIGYDDEYLQDRATPSFRRKECTAFLAPSRDAPFNGGRRGVIAPKEEAQISGQIERMESLCRNRQQMRDDASSRLWEAENAVNVECRPQASPRTPRASFLQFVEEMEMYQQAAEWMKQNEEDDKKRKMKEGGVNDSAASPAANGGGKKEQQGEVEHEPKIEEATNQPRPTSATSTNSNNNNNNNVDLHHLQKFYYGRVSDYDAVRKLQEQQYIAATRVTNAGGTALRIRDQKSKLAADVTGFANPLTPRQRTVRIMDPALEHANRIRFFRNSSSASGDGSDFDSNGGGGGGGGHGSAADGNGGTISSGNSSSAIGRPIASNYGNYCRQSFYNVPTEIFRHVATPRMSPRTHSANAVKTRDHVEYNRLVAAGKIKTSSLSASNPTQQIPGDALDEEKLPETTSTLSLGLKEAIAAELKKRQQEKRRALAMRQQRKNHDLNSFIVPDAPITIRAPSKKYAIYKDEDREHFKQVDANDSCGVSFPHQSGREHRPLSAGAISYSGFATGMSVEILKRCDEASSNKGSHLGCVPMQLPLHEKKPPPTQRITITPKYGYVHAASPAVGFGSPPAPRAPIVYGSPERLKEINNNSMNNERGRRNLAKKESKHDDFVIPDKVAPPTRTLGAFMPTNVVYDFRESLNIQAGINLTHPKSIRDIRMPVIKKDDDDDQQQSSALPSALMSVTSLPEK